MKRLMVTFVVFSTALSGLVTPVDAAGNADVLSLRGHRRSVPGAPSATAERGAACPI